MSGNLTNAAEVQSTAVPKTLVISGTLPGTGGVGNLLVGDCYDAIPQGHRVFCGIVSSASASQCVTEGLADAAFVRKYETAFRPLRGIVGECIAALVFRLLARPRMWLVGRKISRWAKTQKVTMLWAILDAPTTIFVARQVAKSLKIPFRTFVMDACEHGSTQMYHDRFTKRYIRREFDAAVRASEACGVAGETMKAAYEENYGIPCTILRQGAVSIDATPVADISGDGPLRIGFAGTITAADAFACMVSALDTMNWRFNDRPIILRIIGARYDIKTSSPKYIEHMGWRSREDTNRLLAECDVLYLPQPFNDEQRLFAELSFPNKLVSYLGAQRPILLHAPAYAALVQFLGSYNVGQTCTVNSCEAFVDSLTKLMTADSTVVQQYVNETRRAVQEELNLQRLQANCRSLLGYKPTL
jgi:hypothetical protein